MKPRVTRTLLAIGVVGALSATALSAASADTFAWTYSGVGCTVEICGFGPDVFPPQPMTGSGYLTTVNPVHAPRAPYAIATFTGSWNGFNITGLLPTDPSSPYYFFNDNTLLYPLIAGQPDRQYLDIEGLGFAVDDGTGVNLFYEAKHHYYFAIASNDPPYGYNTFSGGSFGTFVVTPVPEPSTWLLIIIGFAGLVWVLPGKAHRQRLSAPLPTSTRS